MNRSDDTISRRAAIRWIKAECNPYGKPTLDFESCKKLIENLKQMPSAQLWIPVSERLPKPDEEVFVYLWGNVPHLASVNSEGQWETDQFYLDADDTPKAWMPLPEVYKGENDG